MKNALFIIFIAASKRGLQCHEDCWAAVSALHAGHCKPVFCWHDTTKWIIFCSLQSQVYTYTQIKFMCRALPVSPNATWKRKKMKRIDQLQLALQAGLSCWKAAEPLLQCVHDGVSLTRVHCSNNAIHNLFWRSTPLMYLIVSAAFQTAAAVVVKH